MSPAHRISILTLLFSLALPLAAANNPYLNEFNRSIRDNDEKPEWQEGEVKLPEAIKQDDLQEFQLDPPDPRFHYFIERGSLQTDADGVTRFLLVIRSTSGAINSSYEGLRCGHRQYKVYAYGSGQGLKRLPGALWQGFAQYGGEAYRQTLYNDLLCDLTTGKANPPATVFQAMRKGKRVKNLLTPD